MPNLLSIPREGLYINPLFNIINNTLLGPHLLIAVTYVTHQTPGTLSLISKILLAYSIIFRINAWLNHWSRNNWIASGDEWKNWDKELVLLTGGSSGIGALVAQDLEKRGICVIVVDIEPPKYQAGPNITYHPCDLSSPTAITSLASKIRNQHGNPTVLINNAGLTRGRFIAESTPTDVALTLHTNLHSQFHLLRHFLPSMIASNHGHIISIASLSGYMGPPGLIDYAASKAGVISLHEGLGLELLYRHNAPRVRTSLVVPSYVKTPMFAGTRETSQPWFVMPLLEPETVAEAVVERVVSGEAATVFLPGFMGVMTIVKALPYWVQAEFGRGAKKTDPKNFLGRQKVGEDGRLVVEGAGEKGGL